MQFCRVHNLELSTSFLRECAKSNEWLQFLVQTQLHGHQPAQVVPLLQDFPPVVRDHLLLALGKLLCAEAARAGSVFQMLLQCQEEPSPCWHLLAEGLRAHAPILSVLAACCPDANLISCLCVWIITSVDGATRAEATAHTQSRAGSPQWDLQDLAAIWKVLLRKQKSKTLLNGFQLFLKDSPLLHILEMYELCMNCKKYNEAKTKLEKFQESLTELGAAAGAAPEVPGPWLRSQALFLLELMLQQSRTDYELGKLLQLLAATENLLLDGPHVKRLCALSEALRGSSISISRSILTSCSLQAFQEECSSILEQLQEKGMFSLAREVAALADEKHNMIALCFSMCREIGQNHEAAASTQLKLIECRPWEESLQDVANLKKLLLKALTLFIDAAESYSKDSCVRQALRCRRLTRLITLQLHFLALGQSTRIINLGRQDLPGAILALPRFYQAAIVAEAYEFLPDWAEVLFQQVITRGDFVYLEEFKQQRPLRPSLFEEVAKRVQQHPPADAALRNLKRFLTHCEDIYTYYRLAYDHKFYDVVNSLLKDPQTGCCLNDLLSN
uniref:Spatacsin C-terminal domain-containing protein n=1 Tax=Cyanistes caeruleus TaxID=156563 RepID=A0A8C0UG16_CYACU